jgi:hypothetical protein
MAQPLSHTIKVTTEILDACGLVSALGQIAPIPWDEAIRSLLPILTRGRKAIGEDLIEDGASDPTRIFPHRKELEVLCASDVVILYPSCSQPSIAVTIDQEESITRLPIDDRGIDTPPLLSWSREEISRSNHRKESWFTIVIDPKDRLLDRKLLTSAETKGHILA